MPVTIVHRSLAFRMRSLYTGWMLHSSALKNRVPICTPQAPSRKAAATPAPSAMPPAAITGRLVASQT